MIRNKSEESIAMLHQNTSNHFVLVCNCVGFSFWNFKKLPSLLSFSRFFWMILSIFGAQHFGCSLLSTMMYRRYKVDVKEFPPPALSTWEGFDLHNLGDQWQFCKSLGSPKTDILNPTKKGKLNTFSKHLDVFGFKMLGISGFCVRYYPSGNAYISQEK